MCFFPGYWWIDVELFAVVFTLCPKYVLLFEYVSFDFFTKLKDKYRIN